MDPRFVTRTVHAYLDYPVAISLMVMPFILGLGNSHPLAFWLSVLTGAAAFILTLLTDHETGVLRVIPYSLHLAVDAFVGVAFVLASIVFAFSGIDSLYYWLNAAAVLFVTSMHKPESSSSEFIA